MIVFYDISNTFTIVISVVPDKSSAWAACDYACAITKAMANLRNNQ